MAKRPASAPIDRRLLADRLRRAAETAKTESAAMTAASADAVEAELFVDYALRFRTAKGRDFSFERFPFQREIYEISGNLEIEDVTVMKSVQVGISELLTRLALFMADVYGLTVVYVFPALKQMYDFSDTRFDALVDKNSYLQNLRGAPWSKGLKRLGDGFVYFRGSESKNDLIGIDADVVVLDEYDQLDPPNIPEAEKRIAASEVGLLRRIGVPSDPDWGIARRYEQSDKRQWMVRCGNCAEGWQPIDFWKNVAWEDDDGYVRDPRIVCRRCKKRLDETEGEWVAERSERLHPGFHVHRLMVGGESNLRAVIEASKQRNPSLIKNFWTNDLGLPHEDRDAGLDRMSIAAALSAAESFYDGPIEQLGAYQGTNLVTAGIDVASARSLHVRISEHVDPITAPGHRKRALYIGTCDSFDEVAVLLDRYNVHFACIDHLPEMRLARGLAERYPGRVYLVRYGRIDSLLAVDWEMRTATAQRVPAMDATAAVMRAQRNLLPVDLPRDYVEHMVAPRRKIEKDQYDRQAVEWQSKRPDDYFQAETYDVVATNVARVRTRIDEITREEVWRLDELINIPPNPLAVDEPYYHPGPPEPRFGYPDHPFGDSDDDLGYYKAKW